MAVDSLDKCGVYFRYYRRAGVPIRRCGRHVGTHRPRFSGRAFRRGPDTAMIRVELPPHLRGLARISGEVRLDIQGLATQRSVVDALEAPLPDAARRDPRSHNAKSVGRFFAVLRLRRGPFP